MVAAGIRLANFSGPPLWSDERATVVESQGIGWPATPVDDSSDFPVTQGLVDTAREAAGHDQPVYIAIMNVWTRAFGVSEGALRLPSVVAGALSIPLLFLAARKLVGVTAAWIAALLFAISPLHTALSQEARTYAITVALAVASLLAAVTAGTSKRPLPALVYGLLAGTMSVFHLLAGVVIVPQVLWLALKGLRARRAALVAAGIALPWLAAMPLGVWESAEAAHRESGLALRQPPAELVDWARPASAFNLAAGVAHVATKVVGIDPDAVRVRTRHVLLATAALLGVAVFGMRGLDGADKVLLGGGVLFPVMTSLLLALWYGHVVPLQPRYLLWIVPSMALLIGRGAQQLGRQAGGAAVAIAAGLSIVSLLARPGPIPDPIRLRHETVVALMQCYAAGDVVAVPTVDEGMLLVAFGGRPVRLAIGRPPASSPDRRWILSGSEMCAS
ncbi:MAG TPA: glycosyltransferase family 39 protein, partial [Vicinamibacteria bacterium]|nr:glycosyltransferase family 39 protein [Vicinamibacteria bacterium]